MNDQQLDMRPSALHSAPQCEGAFGRKPKATNAHRQRKTTRQRERQRRSSGVWCSADMLNESGVLGLGGNMHFDKDRFASRVRVTRAAGELQEVLISSGAATDMMSLRELASVGCPTWSERALEEEARATRVDAPSRRRFTCYCLGLDAGPDNLNMARRIVERLKNHALIMFIQSVL